MCNLCRIEPPMPAPHQLHATLEVLSLQDNPVGDQGLYALARVLCMKSSRLRSLNMSRTNLTDTSAPALEQIMGSSLCLESLDLSWNKLGILSGKAIGNGLFRAKSLTNLHLGWNNLQNSGTEALAEALRFSPDCSLRTLNLSAARMQSEVIDCKLKLDALQSAIRISRCLLFLRRLCFQPSRNTTEYQQ